MMKRNLAFEIGTEEIPSAALYSAREQLHSAAVRALADSRLEYGQIRTYATPRRLILMVTALASSTESRSVRLKGPSVQAAFDAEGAPTRAAIGFARGKGVDVGSLEIVEDDSGSYVWAIVDEPAKETIDLLPEILLGLISSIDFKKSQRWGATDERFIRPVRWLFALYGQLVVPVEFAGVRSGRLSRGHRLLAPESFSVAAAEGLVPSLENVFVIPQVDYRLNAIRRGIESIEKDLGVQAVIPEGTFAEVVNLVEYPTVAVGTFDPEFLDVPREIIVDAMVSHQRYFPMQDAEGILTNRFIVVHNGDPSRTDSIVAGHERVIRARLSDAAFFYHEDLKRPLDSYVARLDTIVFHEKLGSVADKVSRIERLVDALAGLTDQQEVDRADALRAARLCKADLVTSAVIEFTSLQGVMGGYYATASGENEAVAEAIVEHYRPKFSGDDVPGSIPGKLVALADKIDTICGIFSVGQGPTGSSDPFALRRAAIGVLNIMLDGPTFDIRTIAQQGVSNFSAAVSMDVDNVVDDVVSFFLLRLHGILKERGFSHDTVDAVLALDVLDPADALARCEALENARANDAETFRDLAVAFARANNLRDESLGSNVSEEILGAEELVLFEAIEQAERDVAAALPVGDFDRALSALASLRGPIDSFFEAVLIMDPDVAVRENRLRLLNRFVMVFARVLDFSKLGG